MPLWQKGLDLLSRPNYASAAFAHSLLVGGNPFKAALQGFTGEKRITYSDVLKTAGMDKGLARATLGFAGDVLLDPTTYVTFGTGPGAKVTVGGVAKTLTKGASLAHDAMAAEKSLRLAELIPKLQKSNPQALERLLQVTGLTAVGRDMAPELLAKVAGGRVATQSLGKAIEGKAIPAGMEAALGGIGKTAKDLVQTPALRFMGMEVPGSRAAIAGAGRLAKGTYAMAEKIPVAGKAFTAVRHVAEKTAAAAKAVFSTATGLPEFDRLVKQYQDILDYKTMQIVSEYRDKIIKPMKAIRDTDPKAYQTALKEINTFLEGVVEKQVSQVPDVEKITAITKQVDNLTGRLAQMEGGIQKFEQGAMAELETALKQREKGAIATAKAETAGAREAWKAGPGELLKELRERGIKRVAGIAQAEYAANVPKGLRRKAGVPMDELIQELSRRELLPPGATQEDLYELLGSLSKKPSKVTPEQVLERVPAPTKKAVPAEMLSQKAAIEGELAGAKKQLADKPTKEVKELKIVQGPVPSHPDAAVAAQFIKDRFESIWRAEQAGLALPPNKMEFYLPHYMKGEVRDAMIDIINSDARKLVRPEFVGRLSETMRRSATGKVDELMLMDLVESGVVDPSKARELLNSRGVKLTGDDMLVFENDPIKIALNRELRSIRALNSSEMAKDILESPVFLKSKVKLGDVDAIRRTLDQHPDHALFVPTKTFIEKFKTAGEREAMYLGKDKQLASSFIQEVERVMLGEIAEKPEKAVLEAYIIPREVAHHLSKAYTLQFDEKALSEFFRVWDKMSGWWKTFATAVRPGFHVRNEVSNLWQLTLAGVRGPEPLYKALMVLSNPEAVSKIGQFTGPEVRQLAEKYGILRTGFVGSDIEDLIRREIDPSKNPLSTSGPIARLGSKVGTAIEDHARLSLFIDQLQKGADVTAAAMHTKKYMFDYRDLTRIEKGLFRRILPFYSWTRKSIPLAIETVLTKPGYASALGKIREAGEKNVEDPIKNEYVASWIKEGLGVPIRKTPDGKTEFFLLKGWIPLADLAKMDVEEAFGMLHPAFKAPIELAMNRNVFTGRPIERFPGQQEKFMGIPMRGKAAHLIRNLVFMQELDRLFFREEFDAARAAAGSIGYRTYKQDKVVQMRTRVYDLQGQMGELKNVISLATKRHGADSSLVKQAEERLQTLIAERDRVKSEVLEIDPEALSTRKPKEHKEKPLPRTMEGFRRSVDLDHLLRPAIREAMGRPVKKREAQ